MANVTNYMHTEKTDTVRVSFAREDYGDVLHIQVNAAVDAPSGQYSQIIFCYNASDLGELAKSLRAAAAAIDTLEPVYA